MDKFLLAAYILDQTGSGKELTLEQVNAWTEDQGILWLHLNYTCKKTHEWLNKKSGLSKLTISALCADESRPRSIVLQSGLLSCLRGVNLNPGNDPEDMVSIRIWVDKNRIITTRRRHILSIDDIKENIKNGTGPDSPSQFLRMLNDRLTDRMSDVIEDIDEQVDELEQNVITQDSHCLRPQIADIRRQSILIRRYLAPQREALNRLYFEENSFITKTDRAYLREAADRVVRYIEDLDSDRERSAIIQEELSSRLSEQMNHRMYILSVAAVIFLPLTFITGLLGINVAGIPGANYKWAFEIVCAGLIAITGVMLFAFRRKKWM